MGAAILFPKFLLKLQYNAFDGPIRNVMAAQRLLSSISAGLYLESVMPLASRRLTAAKK